MGVQIFHIYSCQSCENSKSHFQKVMFLEQRSFLASHLVAPQIKKTGSFTRNFTSKLNHFLCRKINFEVRPAWHSIFSIFPTFQFFLNPLQSLCIYRPLLPRFEVFSLIRQIFLVLFCPICFFLINLHFICKILITPKNCLLVGEHALLKIKRKCRKSVTKNHFYYFLYNLKHLWWHHDKQNFSHHARHNLS